MFVRGVFLALVVTGAAAAQDADPEVGQHLFMTYCWQCHGDAATGNGPMAEVLSITTPDLTRLSARNDGVFPMELVARHIDGRAPLRAHGGEMPIFGPFFESDQHVALRLPSGQPMLAPFPLASVIVYLESLQQE